ncbi:MAG: phenylalanine--tRNA ligase subunit alpha [Bacteroidetes bacterium]|nr:phenylalanine--tRNA ligase subunit alpha [Bacteroidota bacterium]MBL7113995.1 phenylalanine--tRNA ligase subunit alpha [Bacteroidales bacterium]
MIDKLSSIIDEINSTKISGIDELESFRIKYLGKKGVIAQLFNDFKSVPAGQKKEFGQKLNETKQLAQQKYDSLKSSFPSTSRRMEEKDLTLPGDPIPLGSRHPISIARNKIIDIFRQQGFTIAEGPEIEDDWHNFSALNFSVDHPARDMQDTFFIQQDPDILLRTHTSSVQVRYMENQSLPIRAVFPGRVFRNEAISARAHCIFHQVEGLYIHKNVSFVDMKQILFFFAREMFGIDTKIRLRPSYFPFTEPSAEMDISCSICKGKGCNICKYTGWVEIMGCGMVDPNVLSNCGIDPEIYTGYAFGMGIERISMLKYGINDLRLYFDNDKRLLDQFISFH